MSVWIGVVAPPGTPAPVLWRMHAMVQGLLNGGRGETPWRQPESNL